MSGGSAFEILKTRINDLRDYLLPDPFDETGFYENPDHVSVRSLAFRVLAHAEIEAYFEEQVIQIASSALEAWEQRRHINCVSASLLAFAGAEMKLPPETLAAPDEQKSKGWPEKIDLGEKLKLPVNGFNKRVRLYNNGVREKDLLSLLLPIGIHCEEIDPTFLASIDSFGRKRGEAAHRSTSGSHVTQGVDPKTEYQSVLDLLIGIDDVNRKLAYLLAKCSES